MNDECTMPATLREHRPLLLALEAIGWLHMAGKAKVDFLKLEAGDTVNYHFKDWYKNGSDIVQSFCWLDQHLQKSYTRWKLPGQAPTLQNLIKSFFEDFDDKISKLNLVGLLQAAHGTTSGVEKNLPQNTSDYLKQNAKHLWLSSAFGNPERNLLVDPPEILSEAGWRDLVEHVRKLLLDLEALGNPASPHTVDDIEGWWSWREGAVGESGWLRKAFSQTLAETRLPDNDVTLFDQSYVTAALFKSAAAGAILEGTTFNWNNPDLKQTTQWRLFTVGLGAGYYEGRSVQIGDWLGADEAMADFFLEVRKFIEIDLAVGSLLYADDEVSVFSFPSEQGKEDWQDWLTKEVDAIAGRFDFETPPLCSISEKPSRSLVAMTEEIRRAKNHLATPLHRSWCIPQPGTGEGHVCPVCMVRRNGDKNDKQKTCASCTKRRHNRLDRWLKGDDSSDTIWISEVADSDDRLALITMSLGIEPWLDGSRLDSLRSQAIGEWREHNPVLTEFWNRDKSMQKTQDNPVRLDQPDESLKKEIEKRLDKFACDDLLLANLQEGYRHEKKGNRTDEEIWKSYFGKIVEDRSPARNWDKLDPDRRAAWLAHQLFRKLASPGRIYRFQRQSTEFFQGLENRFREVASADENRWRMRRLLLEPETRDGRWKDGFPYSGHLKGAPIDLLWKEELDGFITITNLGRLLKATEGAMALRGKESIDLKDDDNQPAGTLTIGTATDLVSPLDHLGTYCPIIPLGLSPGRFRVLVPLSTVSACVDEACSAWEAEYGRVRDRLPLRIAVVAFPRKTPFQDVLEAARNVEADIEQDSEEHRRITEVSAREGCTCIRSAPTDSSTTEPEPWSMPIELPDGRTDVFYPYLEMDQAAVVFPLDFRGPNGGHVYRHAKDIRKGDTIVNHPSRVVTVFLDDSARRFEPCDCKSVEQWREIRKLWEKLNQLPLSQTALRGAWAMVLEKRNSWKDPDGKWLPEGEGTWGNFVRSVFRVRLTLQGPDLEKLVRAAKNGTLEWCLEWNLHVLKARLEEVAHE